MTLERLKQYRSLVREIDELEQQHKEQWLQRDTVKGSMTEFPYIETTVTICGYNPRVSAQLRMRQNRLLSERLAIERFIDEINDSLTRRVIFMRYVQGMSWNKLARNVPGNTPDSLRMLVTRHMRSN